jgi:hypothetical protein
LQRKGNRNEKGKTINLTISIFKAFNCFVRNMVKPQPNKKKLARDKDILARSWWQDDSKAFESSCHHDLAKPYRLSLFFA